MYLSANDFSFLSSAGQCNINNINVTNECCLFTLAKPYNIEYENSRKGGMSSLV